MLFSIKFLSKTSQGAELIAMQSPDASLLAALPVRGDTVLLPLQEGPSEPIKLAAFIVEGRVFTYASDLVLVSIVVEQTDMVTSPEAKV